MLGDRSEEKNFLYKKLFFGLAKARRNFLRAYWARAAQEKKLKSMLGARSAETNLPF